MDNNENTQQEKIKAILAKQLGLEPDDISIDDSLTSDLHMRATDITDFIETLENEGYETSNVDLTTTDTLEELIDALNIEI